MITNMYSLCHDVLLDSVGVRDHTVQCSTGHSQFCFSDSASNSMDSFSSLNIPSSYVAYERALAAVSLFYYTPATSMPLSPSFYSHSTTLERLDQSLRCVSCHSFWLCGMSIPHPNSTSYNLRPVVGPFQCSVHLLQVFFSATFGCYSNMEAGTYDRIHLHSL